jgi:hypothetical protein
MSLPAHISFRLSAQRALLTHITPPLRAVSLAVDEPGRRWAIRFVFDGRPSESQLEAARCAVTEMLADFPEWEFTDEFLFVPAPGEFRGLEWAVYSRCEDSWVGPDAEPLYGVRSQEENNPPQASS